MPPCATWTPRRRWPAFSWRLRMLTPLTTILCCSGMVRSTSPCLPLSLPAMTITGSPAARSSQRRLACSLFLSMCWLKDLRRERDDLHEVALAKLARDWPEDAGAARVVGLRQQHGRVLVEADQRAVWALVLLVDPDHDGLHHLALLDLPARLGGLDRGGDDVAHGGVLAVVAAGHADDQELLRPRVVRDLQTAFLLDHRLLGLLHDLEHAPALLPRDGARLGDAHEVSHAALVLLVVDLEPRALLDRLAVQAVGLRGADLDDDGLVHLVRDHRTEADLAPAARLNSGCRVAHSVSPFESFDTPCARPARPRLGLGASSSSTSATATAACSGCPAA